jgi:DNA-binding transcriptional regulator YhcF (GntR family)
MIFQDNKAIYLQIADYVCENVIQNKWPEGEKIPSVRELAASIAVNPNTIMRAYTYLEEKKVIETHRGVGYFVCKNAKKIVTDLKKQEFISTQLPNFFKAMDLLGIRFEEIHQLYHLRESHEKK